MSSVLMRRTLSRWLYFVDKNAKMNAAMYREVLEKHLKPSLRQTGCSVFMQDGAPCHTARSIKE